MTTCPPPISSIHSSIDNASHTHTHAHILSSVVLRLLILADQLLSHIHSLVLSVLSDTCSSRELVQLLIVSLAHASSIGCLLKSARELV
jgi:hypothetical protein